MPIRPQGRCGRSTTRVGGRCTEHARCPPTAFVVPSWHDFSGEDEKRISLRLPTNLHALLVEAARTDRRSLNSEIVHLLETALGPAGGDDQSP
nr:Arc family DNA-binding protein [Streptomyces sp. LaPpAH-108]